MQPGSPLAKDAWARLERALGSRFRLETPPPGFPTARPPSLLLFAREAGSGQCVVVKAMTSGESGSALGLRFEREVGSVQEAPGWLGQEQLADDRLLPILARGGSSDVVYYVTPWLPEGSLRDRLARPPHPTEAEGLRVLDDVAHALGRLHGRGLVHGRLKPENVLFSAGRAVLADGFSRLWSSPVGAVPRLEELDYEAPEVVRGGLQASSRSDVYGLATLGFELLAGRRPFVGSPVQVAWGKVSGEAPAASDVRPGLSRSLAGVLARGLARDPAERFADAAQFLDALRCAAGPTGGN